MNNWSFTGNLGGDAESRFTPAGDAVVKFNVAVKSGFGEKSATTWARCDLWGKRGEAVAQYLTKGQLVGINGELTLREFTNKDGNKQVSLEVRVNDLSLLGKRDDQQSPQHNESTPTQNRARSAPAQTNSAFDDMTDDIPF